MCVWRAISHCPPWMVVFVGDVGLRSPLFVHTIQWDIGDNLDWCRHLSSMVLWARNCYQNLKTENNNDKKKPQMPQNLIFPSWKPLSYNMLCSKDIYTAAQRSWRGDIILDSPCPSVRPSVCRRHGFRSISFRTVTQIWIHQWVWNDAQILKWHRRGALLFCKVIRQISRSHSSKNRRIWPKLGVSGL